jgi:hypothetical protein
MSQPFRFPNIDRKTLGSNIHAVEEIEALITEAFTNGKLKWNNPIVNELNNLSLLLQEKNPDKLYDNIVRLPWLVSLCIMKAVSGK